MSVAVKRWTVRRYAFGRPYRLAIEPAHLRALEMAYVGFVRECRTYVELDAMLADATDCPRELVQALRMTLSEGLFLGHRTGRGGRLVEFNGREGTAQATGLGLEWLRRCEEGLC